ncbi:MAG: sterol carrier family protein [Actinomycetota bacterium]|nr:sterol carrier family protein [Actinomycetota bacterium]
MNSEKRTPAHFLRSSSNAIPVTELDWVHEATELLARFDRGEEVPRDEQRAAVKASLAVLVDRAPGRSVEVRIPPFAAVQVVEGSRHRRGTPPAVVETDATTWLALALGHLGWDEATVTGRLRASGERSDLSGYLPLI